MTGRTVLAAERVDAPAGPKYVGVERLPGRRVLAVTRRGKFLVLPLLGPEAAGAPARDPATDAPIATDELIVHLGMTGVVRHTPPPAHLRVRVAFDGPEPSTLYFQDVRRFGRFTMVAAGAYGALPTLAALGPDALDPAFTVSAFQRALSGSAAAIKTVLLSQRAVAGVGNIYADEALWRVGVHPSSPARGLSKARVAALHGAIRAVLEESLALQGTTLYDYRTVDGGVGTFGERLAVYGHDGEPCPRCGSMLEKLVVGQRGTHVCPRCQVAPGGIAGGRRTARSPSRTQSGAGTFVPAGRRRRR